MVTTVTIVAKMAATTAFGRTSNGRGLLGTRLSSQSCWQSSSTSFARAAACRCAVTKRVQSSKNRKIQKNNKTSISDNDIGKTHF